MTASLRAAHPLDRVFAALVAREPMFPLGWGDDAILRRTGDRAPFRPAPEVVVPRWTPARERGRTGRAWDGEFLSPAMELDEPLRRARVRWLTSRGNRAAVVVLPGSREEGYGLRQDVYGPLVERGIDLLLLESAFYGSRRPTGARSPNPPTLSDQLVMNAATVEEARALLCWLEGIGYQKVGVAGYSMGGYMAALVVTADPRPRAAAVMASGASASAIFVDGLLSTSVDFTALERTGDGGDVRARLAELLAPVDLEQRPPPPRPDATVVLGATRDGYVARSEIERLHRHWVGSELRWVRSGHVSTLILQRDALRQAVARSIERL